MTGHIKLIKKLLEYLSWRAQVCNSHLLVLIPTDILFAAFNWWQKESNFIELKQSTDDKETKWKYRNRKWIREMCSGYKLILAVAKDMIMIF